MIDRTDERLGRAGYVDVEGSSVDIALQALVEHHSRQAQQRRQRRRVWIPTLSLGLALGAIGTGAAVANQWGPWNLVPDADIVIARDWTDAQGVSVGACETRLAMNDLDQQQRDDIRGFFDSVDIESINPDPLLVATNLASYGRIEDLGRLIPGADPSEYDFGNADEPLDPGAYPEASALQQALTDQVFLAAQSSLWESSPETAEGLVSAAYEMQCAASPAAS